MSRFPILMYHALWPSCDDPLQREAMFAADSQLSDPGSRLYALDERVFKAQATAIAASGRRTSRDWEEFPGEPDRSRIALTFDDGHQSNYQIALPILKAYGLTGIFFITTDWIDTPGFMNPEQLVEMRRQGMLLGTHGCSHRYFSDLSEADLRDEMIRSKAKLEGILNEPVSALALPGGRDQPLVKSLARELGYRHVFTSRIELAGLGGDPLDWPRIPITNRQADDFLGGLLNGQTCQVRRMARNARWRAMAKDLLGNAFYDKVRGLLIRE